MTCPVCGESSAPDSSFTCNFCGQSGLCPEHRLPENHNCPGLRSVEDLTPDEWQTIGGDEDDDQDDEAEVERDNERKGTRSHTAESRDSQSTSLVEEARQNRPSRWQSSDRRDTEVTTQHGGDRSGGSVERNLSPGLGKRLKRVLALSIGVLTWPYRRIRLTLRHLYYRPMEAVFSLLSIVILAAIVIGALAVAGGIVGTGFEPVDDTGERALDGINETGEFIANGTSTPSDEDLEVVIHEEVNRIRIEQGLSQLEHNEHLRDVARGHSEHMAAENYFAHESPAGVGPQERVTRAGLSCSAGENIYHEEGYSTADAEDVAERVVSSWMESPSHRENLLRDRWAIEGIGVETDGSGMYVTQNFC